MEITYIKRAKGGYYATTKHPDFFCTVERIYQFTIATNDWIAKYRGAAVIGQTRKEAVELLTQKVGMK